MIRKLLVKQAIDNYIDNLMIQFNPNDIQMIETSVFIESMKTLKFNLVQELELNKI